MQRVPLPLRQPTADGHLTERPRDQLVLDGDARLQRDAEAEPHRFLDRAVRAERKRLRAQVVVGEEFRDKLARAGAVLAHQPDAVGQLFGLHRASARERVVGCDDQRQLVLQEGEAGNPLVVRRASGNRHVDLVF